MKRQINAYFVIQLIKSHKMKTFYIQKSVYLILLSFFSIISFSSFGQTFNSEFQDGKIYLKIKDTEPISFMVNPDNSVDINSIPFIRNLSNNFKIKSLSRPYFLDNDHKLLRTLMLEIADYDKIDQVISLLKQEPTLEYVEKVPLDRLYYVPNDSLYRLYNGPQNWNWHLELIHADQAWDITKGDPNINVAVVDNAVWVDHPDLEGKIVAQRDVVYNTNNANPPSTGDPAEWSHGTHVAGLVGAVSDNEIGVASIGFNVSIIAVKAANNSSPNTISGGFTGIQWAANNGADVINMSWGNNQFSQTNQNIINTVHNMGIVLIAAAGNDNVSTLHYPSAYNNVISVASIDWNDVKSDFSNYGTTVDLSSPGGVASPGPSGLLSTTVSSGTFGYYDSYIGTSMASPVVSGLAGLVLSVNPQLTPDQVEQILKSTSDDISAQNPDYIGMLGVGRINAYQAVLNTPFQPTAQFYTPVEVITPGTSINFINQSTGVPSSWQWTFEGGNPSSSTVPDPQNITYQTAGTYDVTLTVTNEFGSSSVTYFDYVQVVTNPSPYVFMHVSDSLPCIAESVSLIDSSLYGPTNWEWNIEPATFEFVNGTTSTTQNPEVQFLHQGRYNITLTVSNINGMTSRIFENAINVTGVVAPYVQDMENGTSEYFTLWDTLKSQSTIDLRAANNSMWGIHFHGDPVPVGWKGSPTDATPDQAWNVNLNFHGKAYLCGVDARGLTNLKLALDLRQTYSLGPRYSWFRVLVNGEQVPDFEGTIDFNPLTAAADPWKRVQFDLSQYAGQVFDITLESCTRFSDKVQGEGDNVFIDNIEIVNSVGTNNIENLNSQLLIYPNPSSGQINIYFGDINNYAVDILNNEGQLVYHGLVANNNQMVINKESLPVGIYIVKSVSAGRVSVAKLIVGKKI